MIDYEIATATRARNNAPHCGDACYTRQLDGTVLLCVVDGLGHGEQAEIAATSALAHVADYPGVPLPDLLKGCDVALRSTRGVVMSIAVIDQRSGQMTFAGIGNTRGAVVGESKIRLRSHPGIVGAGFDTVSTETFLLTPGDLIILFTDGLPWELDLSGYDETLLQKPSELTERIIRDWYHGTDDLGLLICRVCTRGAR